MSTWQLQEAKARLSEVIKKAKKEGPQSITVHGSLTSTALHYELRLVTRKARDFARDFDDSGLEVINPFG